MCNVSGVDAYTVLTENVRESRFKISSSNVSALVISAGRDLTPVQTFKTWKANYNASRKEIKKLAELAEKIAKARVDQRRFKQVLLEHS